MPASLQTYVVDTSVLIDLHVGGILPALFQLPGYYLVPDVLIGELEYPDGRRLLGCGLIACELADEQVLEVYRLRAIYGQVSVNDLFALVLARIWDAILLTGDKHLRRIAEQENVPVHGVLWVLDETVRLTVLAPRLAAQALKCMLGEGRRLPKGECERRLALWRTMG